MRNQFARTLFVALTGLVLLLAACSTAAEEVTTSDIELTETQVLHGFGYSIDYPSGWEATTEGTVTIFNELNDEPLDAPPEPGSDPQAYNITFEHRELPFMQSIGLPENPTLDDVLELNKTFFEWQDPIEVTERELFDVPAYSVETKHDTNWMTSLMGIHEGRVFLLTLRAASEEARDAFLPTLEQMLQSIRPAE